MPRQDTRFDQQPISRQKDNEPINMRRENGFIDVDVGDNESFWRPYLARMG